MKATGRKSGGRIENYRPETAGQVAELIYVAFRDYEGLRLDLISTPLWEMQPETLAKSLTADAICCEASFVALSAGSPVAAVIARGESDTVGWWRIATHPEFRRRGLASACLAAAEAALRARRIEVAHTVEVLDSRWASACGFLEACGYTVEDAERRNITMQLDIDSWQERPVQVPKGYELARLAEDEVEEWSACRNAIFSSHGGPGWFREHFMQRYDFEFPGWHVVKHESNIVGIAGAQIVREEYDPAIVRGAMIEYVGVLEQHRRQGLAEALMNACLNYCKRLPAGPTMLLTQPFRVPAVRLYQKLGFAKVAEWRRYTKRL